MSDNTVYLDLDAVKPPKRFVVNLNDKQHELKETTVESFIENTRDIEKLGFGGDTIKELELSIRLVRRAFPTITEEEVQKLTFSQCTMLIDFARTANGEKAIDDELKEEATVSENPPAAGQ